MTHFDHHQRFSWSFFLGIFGVLITMSLVFSVIALFNVHYGSYKHWASGQVFGKITQVSSDSIVTVGGHGRIQAIHISPLTRYFYGGHRVTVSDLKPGDLILAEVTRNSPADATAVIVRVLKTTGRKP